MGSVFVNIHEEMLCKLNQFYQIGKIRRSDPSNYLRRCREMGSLIHSWWEDKLVHNHFGRQYASFL